MDKRKSWKSMLQAIPVQNRAAQQDIIEGQMVLTVQKKKPAFLVPPLSWVLRPRLRKRIQLDSLGRDIWQLCDGKRSVEEIIDCFAERENLTFHEARVSVTEYLKNLSLRGVVVMAVNNEELVA